MYSALALFVCGRSVVFCQKFWQITQRLLADWTGGGERFSWASWAGAPSPLACLSRTPRSFLCPFLPSTGYAGYSTCKHCTGRTVKYLEVLQWRGMVCIGYTLKPTHTLSCLESDLNFTQTGVYTKTNNWTTQSEPIKFNLPHIVQSSSSLSPPKLEIWWAKRKLYKKRELGYLHSLVFTSEVELIWCAWTNVLQYSIHLIFICVCMHGWGMLRCLCMLTLCMHT